MSVLLDIVTERHQRSPERLWSGALVQFKAPWPAAEPEVVVRRDGRALVEITGSLPQSSLSRLAFLIASLSDSLVYLSIASDAGELHGLRSAAEAIERHGNVVVHIRVASGAALYLAQHCGMVLADPMAVIGGICCAVDSRLFTCEPPQMAPAPDLTECMAADLAAVNPKVPHEEWMKLARHTVNGERAEQLGIVNLVRNEVWRDG